MAKQRSFEWNFAAVVINTAEKKKFEAWFHEQSASFFKHVDDMISEGYKLSISPDFENQCIIATWSWTKNAAMNANTSLVSRSEDMTEAILLGVYKHVVLCNGGEWPTEPVRNNWG